MCRTESQASAHADSESSNGDNAKVVFSTDEHDMKIALDSVPSEVLKHVIDVHCHPTDSDMDMTLIAVQNTPVRMCAMATRGSDQRLVGDLARAQPDRVIPCFGG